MSTFHSMGLVYCGWLRWLVTIPYCWWFRNSAPLGMVLKPCKQWDILRTSTGETPDFIHQQYHQGPYFPWPKQTVFFVDTRNPHLWPWGLPLMRLMHLSLKIPFWPPKNSGWKWHIPTIADSNSLSSHPPKKKKKTPFFFSVVDSRAYMSLAKKLCFSHRLQTHQAIRRVVPWHFFVQL